VTHTPTTVAAENEGATAAARHVMAERRVLIDLLRQARSDLAAYVDADWPAHLCEQYPSYARKRERDMALCYEIDAALAAFEKDRADG
jgi:hypothetical protein